MVRASSVDSSLPADGRTNSRRTRERRLNVPLLAGTLIAAVVLGPAAYCWHSYRLTRTGETVLNEAEQSWEEGQFAKAADLFGRYLKLQPDDADAKARLAEAFDKSGRDWTTKSRAIELYYQALGGAPGEKEAGLRRRLAELLLQFAPYRPGYFGAAKKQADTLCGIAGQEGAGRRLLALALEGQFRSGGLARTDQDATDVVKAFEEALMADVNRGNVELSVALAGLYRDEEQLPKAKVSAILAGIYGPADPPAGGPLSRVMARIDRASQTPLGANLAKTLTKVVPQAAEHGRATLSSLLKAGYGRRDGKGKGFSPEDERLVVGSVRRLLADDVVDQMVAANPKSAEAFLARYRYRTRYDRQHAKGDLAAALKLAPDDINVQLAAGDYALQAAGGEQGASSPAEVKKHLDEARAHYEKAVKVAPSNETAYLRLGGVYLAQGKPDRAVETWRQGSQRIESIALTSRLADALIDLGRLGEAWIAPPVPPEKEEEAKALPLDNLEVMVRNRAAWLSRADRLSLDRSVALLQGKWFLRHRDYARAIPLFKAVTTGQESAAVEAPRAYQAWPYLSMAYAGSGDLTQAARCWEEAAAVQPRLAAPRVRAAEAWMKAGRFDLAVAQYRLALAITDDPEVRFRLAETELERQARLPAEKRGWDVFTTALEDLKKPQTRGRLNEAWRVPLLEARFTIAQVADESPSTEQLAKRARAIRRAKELLDQAQKDYPDSPRLLAALVTFYEGLGCPTDADHALEEYAKLTKGSAAAWRLRSQVLSARAQYDEARRVLREGIEKVPPEQDIVLEAALPEISLAAGELERAQKEWLSLHTKYPSNVEFMRRLADLALTTKRWGRVEEWEGKLHEVEGENGVYWRYCQASRLLETARQAAAKALASRDRETIRKTNAEVAPLIGRAAKLCNELRTARPEWPRVYALSGWVFELQGRVDQAVDAYRKSLDLGGDAPGVYERLIPLLEGLRRFDEADRYLARLKTQGRSLQSLLPYEISAAGRQGGLPEAIAAARRGIEAQPSDPMARIWYGQTLLADGQKDAAEAEFKRAVELAPANARTHLALFDFYVRTQQREQAEQTLQALAQKAHLSRLSLAYQLAGAYERLGDVRKAADKYREAESLAKDDSSRIAIKFRLASLLGRSDLAETEKVLREILELSPGADAASQKLMEAARQSLVNLLAQRALALPDAESEDQWKEVQRLLEASGSAGKGPEVSHQLQGLLLLRQGGKEATKQAQQVFEKLVEDGTGDTDIDRFCLAQVFAAESALYQQDQEDAKDKADEAKSEADRDKFKKAEDKARDSRRQSTLKSREQFLPIVARDNPNPLYLASYVDLLLRHAEPLPQQFKDEATRWRKKLETMVTQAEPNVRLTSLYFNLLRRHKLHDEADQWLGKLEKLSPENLYVLSLRALWLRDANRAAEIEPLVDGVADALLKKPAKDGQQNAQREAAICWSIGNIYSGVQQEQAAERWYRRLLAAVPERFEPLAMSLTRQGRVTEAIQICLEAAKSDNSPRPAIALASVLTSGQPTQGDFQLAEPLLSKARKMYEDNAALLGAVANVRVVQERYEDAVELYQQAVKLDEKNPNPIVLNNLATLLAEEPETRADALKNIDLAIQIAGPNPQYLDTKGTALIYSGKAAQAIPVLEKAASGPRPDPRFAFHLAVAYYRAGQTDNAKRSLAKALAGDLKKKILTKKDLEFLTELQQELLQ
jgi:tetratricopeptide (TPR) repeat protein